MKDFFLLVSLLPLLIYGTEEAFFEEKARFTEVMVQARFYDESLARYRELLDENLDPWQRNVIVYNLGTVLLQMQRWQEALDQFKVVTFDVKDSPRFLYRYWYNRALAHYALASRQVLVLDEDLDAAHEDLIQREKQLNAATQSVVMSHQAHCRLTAIEGSEGCAFSEDIIALKVATKALAAQQAEERRRLILAKLPCSALAARVVVLLEERIQTAIEGSQAQNAAWFHQLGAHEVLWEILASSLSQAPLQQDLFEWAFTQYQSALATTSSLEALPNLQRARVALLALMDLEMGRDPVDTLLALRGKEAPSLPSRFVRDVLNQQSPLPGRLSYWKRLLAKLDQQAPNADQDLDPIGLYHLAMGRDIDIVFRMWHVDEELFSGTSLLAPFHAEDLSSIGERLLQLVEKGRRETDEALNAIVDIDPLRWLALWVQRLSAKYLLFQAHRQFDDSALQHFMKEFMRLNHFLELVEEGKMAPETHDRIAEQLALIKTSHEQGARALQVGYPEVAGIFFADALHRSQLLVSSVLAPTESPVELALSEAVAEQAHALRTVDAARQLPSEQRQAVFTFSQPVHDLMRYTQREALDQMPPFLRAVKKFQDRSYHLGASKKCLRQPWEQALPLVFVGEAAAARASGQLSESESELALIQDEQRVAYKKWSQALERLRQSQIAAEEQTPQAPSDDEKEDFQQVLRLLQHMHLSDQWDEPVQQPSQPGGRPW